MLLNVLTQVMQIDAETSCLDIQLVTQLSTDVMTVHVLEHPYLHRQNALHYLTWCRSTHKQFGH